MPAKPKKPYPDFPLSPHASGKWHKRIKGRSYYFGKWDNPDAALQEYLHARDYLQAGVAVPREGDVLTLAEVCNRFCAAKQQRLISNEIGVRTLREIIGSCRRLTEFFGRVCPVASLQPLNFAAYRSHLTTKYGPATLRTEIQRVKCLFRWAYDASLIPVPMRFGPDFHPPSMRTMRQHRLSAGVRMFAPDEIRAILSVAGPDLRAMVLLGINGGLGQSDCSSLKIRHVNLDTGWLDFPRPKTHIGRRFPLWPETVDALRVSLAIRRKPKDPADAELVFISPTGRAYVRDGAKQRYDGVSHLLKKVRKRIRLTRRNTGFYALRHTFETVAGNSGDQVAVNMVMGHADNSIAALYRESIDDSRLIAVTEHVRKWLYQIS